MGKFKGVKGLKKEDLKTLFETGLVTLPDGSVLEYSDDEIYAIEEEVVFEMNNKQGILVNGVKLLDIIHPIGSYYISDDGEKPQDKFYKLCGYGGTWEKQEGVFLLASSDKYLLGSEGGSADAVVVQHRHTPAMTIAGWSEAHWQVTLHNGNYDYVNSYYRIGGTGSSTATGMQTETGYAGEDGTGKNMPPYIVVDVYKRVEDPVE